MAKLPFSLTLILVAGFAIPSLSSGAVSVDNVGVVVSQIMEQNFAICQLVLVTSTPYSPVFSAIQRHV